MKFNSNINIDNNKSISKNSPTFIIAEAGVNHNGDISIAKKLIDVAVNAKVDAVKFQAFKAKNLILENTQKAPYQKNTTSVDESQYDMLKRLEITQRQNIELKEYCVESGIIFLTTPFDEESLGELDILDLPVYKVSSTDLTNLPFLKKIAKKKKPIFLSTGMSYLSEVRMALETIATFNKDVVLFQCTSNYPIQDNEAHLSVINTYKENFNILLGYSDHSMGVGVAPFAIPMGAKVLEKHFTLDKSNDGPDHAASLSPEELVEFVKIVRRVDSYMGSGIKKPTLSERETRRSLQKCLVASCRIKKGEVFTEDNIVAKRTGGIGISPIEYNKVLGEVSGSDYQPGEVILI